jgi:hypothetical protein
MTCILGNNSCFRVVFVSLLFRSKTMRRGQSTLKNWLCPARVWYQEAKDSEVQVKKPFLCEDISFLLSSKSPHP